MPLNYQPFVVLLSHFRATGGHDLNPPAQTLLGEDQQLFSAFNQIALQVMAQAGVGIDLLPVVVALASMAPSVSAAQRVQLATLFVRNAMAVLNNAAPALADVMLAPPTPRGPRRKTSAGVRAKKAKTPKAPRKRSLRKKNEVS